MTTKIRPRKKVFLLAEQEAIEEFKKWLNENPKVSRKQKYSQFDAFVDTAILRAMLDTNG